MDYAFAYIEKNPLELESAYPYDGKAGKCRADKTKEYGKVTGFTDVPQSAD